MTVACNYFATLNQIFAYYEPVLLLAAQLGLIVLEIELPLLKITFKDALVIKQI